MIIYQVYHVEEWVGEFLQASFSSMDLADAYLAKQSKEFRNECYIIPYILDSA